jgi:hypothetical protein
MTFYQAIQNLLVGETQTERQIGDLKSLLPFFESRLKLNFQALIPKTGMQFSVSIS